MMEITAEGFKVLEIRPIRTKRITIQKGLHTHVSTIKAVQSRNLSQDFSDLD